MAVHEVQNHHPITLPFRSGVARAANPLFEHTFRWRGLKVTVRLHPRRSELVIDAVEDSDAA